MAHQLGTTWSRGLGGLRPVGVPPRRDGFAVFAMAACMWTLDPGEARPAPQDAIPSASQVSGLLQREPISVASWPAWRQRLLDWIQDTSDHTAPAYLAANEFMKGQADGDGKLPAVFDGDMVAWYVLGTAYLRDKSTGGSRDAALAWAEQAFRRVIAIDPKFGRGHARLALVLIQRHTRSGRAGNEGRALEAASRELDEALRLDPTVSWLPAVRGELAMAQRRYREAEQFFRQALDRHPTEGGFAQLTAIAVIQDHSRVGPRAGAIRSLVDRFPKDGQLRCFHAVALAQDGNSQAAVTELQVARELDTDPATVIGPQIVRQIARPRNRALDRHPAALQEGETARDELAQKLRHEATALFSSHPTFRERIAAVARLPRAREMDNTPALQLFGNSDKLEEELTEFLTFVMYQVQQAQAATASE